MKTHLGDQLQEHHFPEANPACFRPLRAENAPGESFDEETGLDYFGARYYAPWLGRWTTADPLGLQAGLNLYLYGRASPVVMVDPNGMEATTPEEILKAVFAPLVLAGKGIQDAVAGGSAAPERMGTTTVEKAASVKERIEQAKPSEVSEAERPLWSALHSHGPATQLKLPDAPADPSYGGYLNDLRVIADPVKRLRSLPGDLREKPKAVSLMDAKARSERTESLLRMNSSGGGIRGVGLGEDPFMLESLELAATGGTTRLVRGAAGVGVGLSGEARVAAETSKPVFSGPKSLRELAREISHSASSPRARVRTVAVGADSEGHLWAGSSNGFDAGMRAAFRRLGVTRVKGSGALHAEGELLQAIEKGKIPPLKQIGTFSRFPCSDAGHMCADRMAERGIGTVRGSGYYPGTR